MASDLFRKAMLGSLALIAASPASADVKAGVDAWSRGNYTAAVQEWRGPAESGDADAQFNLAQAYKLGRGVEQDMTRAEQLFGQAAAHGHLQAADNYGLLLFQRGERARAIPFIEAAAERGEARAQYLLSIAHFNGDHVEKDWVRAYAFASLAQQAGLEQATAALAEMDQHVPLDQRQQSVTLASQLAAQAEANRKRQVAALDLGVADPLVTPQDPTSPPKVAATPAPKLSTATKTPAPKPAPARTSEGPWRVQLGAFGVKGNAESLWNRVRNRPELAGHARILEPAGRLTKLLAGGFASGSDAQAACKRLKAGGFDCIPVGK